MVVDTITIHASSYTGVSANFQEGMVGGINQALRHIKRSGRNTGWLVFLPSPCADVIKTLMSSLLYLVKIKYLGRFLIVLAQLHKGDGWGLQYTLRRVNVGEYIHIQEKNF